MQPKNHGKIKESQRDSIVYDYIKAGVLPYRKNTPDTSGAKTSGDEIIMDFDDLYREMEGMTRVPQL